MTIDEAIKILTDMTKRRNVASLEDCTTAIQLGTEGLKRIKLNRRRYGGFDWETLPGEIEILGHKFGKKTKPCDHREKHVEIINHVTKAPLRDGHWTSFMLMRCVCGAVVGFPDDNYQLALNEGTDETKEHLKQYQERKGDK